MKQNYLVERPENVSKDTTGKKLQYLLQQFAAVFFGGDAVTRHNDDCNY